MNCILLSDDNFFALSEKQLDNYAELYKKNIGLPFRCLAHAHDITERKLRTLVDAGMIELQVGIQTGSEKTRKLYKRGPSTDKILDSVRLINQFRTSLMPVYDFIIDNPFEDEKDLVETLQMIQRFPKPYHLNIFSMRFFPGTELYQMARARGLVVDEIKQFEFAHKTHINFIFFLYNHMPRWIMFILISRPMLAILKTRPVVSFSYSLKSGLRNMIRFLRPFK